MPANPDCVLTVSLLLILIGLVSSPVFCSSFLRCLANAILPSLEINSIMFIRFYLNRDGNVINLREKGLSSDFVSYECLSYLCIGHFSILINFQKTSIALK